VRVTADEDAIFDDHAAGSSCSKRRRIGSTQTTS
jgi:hypothetical protein